MEEKQMKAKRVVRIIVLVLLYWVLMTLFLKGLGVGSVADMPGAL